MWNGDRVRRIRVVRYGVADGLLRHATIVAGALRLVESLPAPGGVLRMLASRWFGVRGHDQRVSRALVGAVLDAAARERFHIVQINLSAGDPLRRGLPFSPRTVFHSTLYGCPWATGRATPRNFHADIALV
jgi:hypothetical protein